MTGLFPAVCVAAGAVPAAGKEQLFPADAADGQRDEHGENQQDEEGGKIHSDPSQRQTDDAHDERRDPGDRTLTDDHAHSPLDMTGVYAKPRAAGTEILEYASLFGGGCGHSPPAYAATNWNTQYAA